MAASAARDAAALAAAGTACVLAGRAAQRARLPQITGYLMAGIATGPAGFSLISAPLLSRLAPVEAACLGAIALAAGAELHLSELQRTRRQVGCGFYLSNPHRWHITCGLCAAQTVMHVSVLAMLLVVRVWQHGASSVRQVLCITAAVALASWLAVGGCLLAAAPAVPFLRTLERRELWAVASLAGTLAMARSPASAVREHISAWASLHHWHGLAGLMVNRGEGCCAPTAGSVTGGGHRPTSVQACRGCTSCGGDVNKCISGNAFTCEAAPTGPINGHLDCAGVAQH